MKHRTRAFIALSLVVVMESGAMAQDITPSPQESLLQAKTRWGHTRIRGQAAHANPESRKSHAGDVSQSAHSAQHADVSTSKETAQIKPAKWHENKEFGEFARVANGKLEFDPGLGANVKKDPVSGVVRELVGTVDVKNSNSLRDLSDSFLKDHYKTFGIDPSLSDLSLSRLDEPALSSNSNILIAEYQQTYQHIPIIGATITVTSNGRTKVFSVSNSTQIITSDELASFSSDSKEAVDAALSKIASDLGVPPSQLSVLRPPKPELRISVQHGRAKPVWSIDITLAHPLADLEVRVNGKTLEVENVHDRTVS